MIGAHTISSDELSTTVPACFVQQAPDWRSVDLSPGSKISTVDIGDALRKPTLNVYITNGLRAPAHIVLVCHNLPAGIEVPASTVLLFNS